MTQAAEQVKKLPVLFVVLSGLQEMAIESRVRNSLAVCHLVSQFYFMSLRLETRFGNTCDNLKGLTVNVFVLT